MSTGAVIARILTQYSDKGSKAAKKDIASLGKSYDHFAAKAAKSFALVGAASLAMATKIGVDSVKAAIEDQKSQALLANSLRNTTGATNAQITALEKHIQKQQLLVAVDENELRPSLAVLATATHSITKAQGLQNLALDIAANRHKDLSAVSIALAKAYSGNFNALKRLGIPLSENLIKSKDFIGITNELAKATAGAASTAARSFAGRMTILGLRIDDIKKSIGYALLPVLEKLVTHINTRILPKIEAWVEANKGKLASSLQRAIDMMTKFGEKLFSLGAWISKHMTLVKEFAVVLASVWAAGKAAAFASAVIKMVKAFQALRTAAKAAAFWEALATGGVSLATGLAATAVLGLGTAWVIASNNAKDANDVFVNTIDATTRAIARAHGYVSLGGYSDTASTASNFGPQALNAAELKKLQVKQAYEKRLADYQKNIRVRSQKEQLAAAKELAKANALAAAQAAKDAAAKMASEKALAALKLLGIKPTTETDPIQLEAARQNIVKQNLLYQDAENQKIFDRLALMNKNIETANRYKDVLAALSDGKLSDLEIANLAAKWGITSDAVLKYVKSTGLTFSLDTTWFAPVTTLTDKWNTLTEAVNNYLSAAGKVPMPNFGNGSLSKNGDGSPITGGGFDYFSPTSTYGSQSPDMGTGSGRGDSYGSSGGASNININLNGYDPHGAALMVQEAVQNLNRNGNSLSGNSSRGN